MVTDAFIRLNDESGALVTTDALGNPRLSLPFADKTPYEFVEVIPAVGNSANAAVAAARLGLSSALIANIGNDAQGKECLDRLNVEKVQTDFITVHDGIKTNYHYVLWYDKDRTILVKHELFPYKLPASLVENHYEPRYLYLSSLGDTTLPYHLEIAEWLSKHPATKLVFQPGTFQIKLGIKTLAAIYARTELFFCNVEEARRILSEVNQLYKEEKDIKKLLAGIAAIGPKQVVITDGPHGAYSYEKNGADYITHFLPAYPDQKPTYERTGAGDSFASTTTAALIKGHSLADAMKWGAANAMSVVEFVGAQKGLLSSEKIEVLLAKAPQDWQATVI